MNSTHERKTHPLRDLTKGEAAEEATYKHQLIRSWAKRPGETWEKKLEREERENAED